MLINVLDKDLKVVAFIDNEVPNLPNYYEDEFNEYLDLGTCSFDFTVKKLNEKGEVNDYVIYLNDKTCFSFIRNGKEYAVFPAGSSGFYENDFEIRYQCLSLDRELSLEYVGKLDNTTSHNLEWYINNSAVISNSQIEIGVNEVASQTRVLNYDGEDTKLNRLLSLISNFDAEFEFVTKLSSSGAVDKIILNIVRERDEEGNFGIGLNRSDVSLTYGKDVYGIERTYDFDFFNYSVITGKDGLSWFSNSFEYYNSEGVLEFYKPANSHGAMAPLSAEKYPAHLKNNASDKYIRKDFSTEYTTVNQMWGYAVQQFKAHAYPKVSYTIKTSSKLITETFENATPLNIGDTVTIQDDNFISEYGSYGLILSARVVQIKSSESNPEKNEIIFNNFKELRGEISDDLLQKMNDLISENTPYRSEISTTAGTQFKNNTTPANTQLIAAIFFGNNPTETIASSYEWFKDDVSIGPGKTLTISANAVKTSAVYRFEATFGDKVVGRREVTITNVNDGEAGSPGAPGIPGTDGRAVTNIEQKYRLTTSSNVPTQDWNDTGWLVSLPTMTSTNKYLWSITRTSFSKEPLIQDVIEQKAVYGDKGDDGSKGDTGAPGKIVSDTEPPEKFKGLTWTYIGLTNITASDGTNILPGTDYWWNGTHWVLNKISANNIEANSIKADKIDATDLEVTNGTFTNGKIKSTWTSDVASGSTEIETSHINMSATDSTNNATNSLGLDVQQGFGMRWTDPASNQSRSVLLDYGNLVFDRNGVAAGLNFDGTNLSSSMPIQAPNTIVKSTQFTVSGIGIRLDRMMSFVAVTFSGQASSTINNTPTINNVLPVGFRPISPYSIDYMVPGNTANNGYIYFNPDGSIRIMATINSGYYIRGTRLYITNDVYPS